MTKLETLAPDRALDAKIAEARQAMSEAADVFRALACECRAQAEWADQMDTGSDAGAHWREQAVNMRNGARRWDHLAKRLAAALAALTERKNG